MISLVELHKLGFGLGTCRILPNFRIQKRNVFNQNQKHKSRVLLNSTDQKTQFQLDCETLGIGENCDHTQARDAFIALAKKYHPDGRTEEANTEKFLECDRAYKNLLKKFSDERHNRHKIEGEYGLYYDEKKRERETEENTDDTPDIKHTVPQHRQYLTNEGIGFGTPFQRQKQYQKYRAARATDNLHEHRIQKVIKETELGSDEKALAVDKKTARKNKTSNAMERLVEDLIQESMARGEFENLKGKGKPLEHDPSYNPYVDFTTNKLNKILCENGFVPEWILLEKEIRQQMKEIRENLTKERHKYDAEHNLETNDKWQQYLKSYLKPHIEELNHTIMKFNLVVPSLERQIICLCPDREVKRTLSNFSQDLRNSYLEEMKKKLLERSKSSKQTSALDHNSGTSILDTLFSVFKG